MFYFLTEARMKRFEGRVAIVTGAGSGIGRATAERLAADGARVVCADVNLAGTEETVATIRAASGEASAVRCDVSDAAAVSALVDGAVKAWGKLDIVANVAGIGGFKRTTDVTLEDWNRMIGINLTGPFLVCRAALPHILASKGAIINTASVAGLKSHPYSAAYCASKGGVVLLTKALAAEYGRKGIRINCVCPGGIETPMIQSFQLPDGVNEAVLTRLMPLGRFGQAPEVAATIAFLASDDAMYINGAAIVVDGGMIA
jgi:NAD(P)-dependent dehydrogenase (short-subunit alcohol dehydrogenase family)